MKVLLDTYTLAELRKPDGESGGESRRATRFPTRELFLSVLTVGEIVKGIAPARRRARRGSPLDVARRAGESVRRADARRSTSRPRRIWGELTARAQKKGVVIPATDGLLAATALRHGLHVMTRNTKHFEASGALIIDPWQGKR